MSELTPCPECQRHVRKTETRCPFCGEGVSLAHVPSPVLPRKRLGRAATFAFGASVAGATALAGCTIEDPGGAVAVYGAPPVAGAPNGGGADDGPDGAGGTGAGAAGPVYGAPAVGGNAGSGGNGGASPGGAGAGGEEAGGAGGYGDFAVYGAPPGGAGN